MHLFLIDLYISIDMVVPVIDSLKKKENIIICNINPIQDHRKNRLIKFLISKKVNYLNFLPIDKKKMFLYIIIKCISILPCYLHRKTRRFLRYIYTNVNFSNEIEIKKFLINKKIKSITFEESAPDIYTSKIYKVAQKLNIEMIKITSGLGVLPESALVDNQKIKFCDKIIISNNKYKINQNIKHKVKIIGSPRYTNSWINVLDRLNKAQKFDKKKITLGFFKKFYSFESSKVEKIIEKLNKLKKFNIICKEKPRDILAVNCNIFDEDKFSSSQLINYSDYIITSRPGSILVEALLKNKEIILLSYLNNDLSRSVFNKSNTFVIVNSEKELFKILNKKKVLRQWMYKKQFLNKIMKSWNKPQEIKNDWNLLYKSIN